MTRSATNTEILQNWEGTDILRVCPLKGHWLNLSSYWQHIICTFLLKMIFLSSEKIHIKTPQLYSVLFIKLLTCTCDETLCGMECRQQINVVQKPKSHCMVYRNDIKQHVMFYVARRKTVNQLSFIYIYIFFFLKTL